MYLTFCITTCMFLCVCVTKILGNISTENTLPDAVQLQHQNTCSEPDIEDVMQFKEELLCNNRFWLTDAEGSTNFDGTRDNGVITGNNSRCPALVELHPLAEWPICPSYKVIDEDENRIPTKIVHHRCQCDRCLSQGRKSGQRKCKSVFRRIPVLRSECTGGTYTYSLAEETVSVACVCTHKKRIRRRRRIVKRLRN